MKAIAYAIICAAYLLVPAKEVEIWPNWLQLANGFVFIICIVGFWVCIMFEDNK